MSLANCPALSQTLQHVPDQESVFSSHTFFPVKIKWFEKENPSTGPGNGLGMLHGTDGLSWMPRLETCQKGTAVFLGFSVHS